MIFLLRALRILKDAVFAPSLSLRTRSLLLILQPITFLTYKIEWAISRKFPHASEIRIPLRRVPGQKLGAIIYTPKSGLSQPQKKVPLHLNIHGGAFLGGLPEGNARLCSELAEKAGAVVVSTSYRYAPVHSFPDAHEDVHDVAEFLIENSERLWNVDPTIFTVSGFSVDFRLPPWQKPWPLGFPEVDPLAFLQPLFDAYNMLFVVGGAEILRDETTTMTERLEAEAKAINLSRGLFTPNEPDGEAVGVWTNVAEGQIHGWTEMSSFAINVELRTKAFGDTISFLRGVHRAYGFTEE
ncbi:Alpha/Beta hydrolase protein [Aspergillus aurantiobrunneus]